MDQTSTQHSTRAGRAESNKTVSNGARRKTLSFIRQFARTYMAVNDMPGLVLN
ncbi:MAG: hypothetical protein NC102_02680 [Clostridium sp.]|nr:hypothetical protein [Clostridium sp.]